MVHLYVHGAVGDVAHDRVVVACELVGVLQSQMVPVRPVDDLFKYGHGEWVRAVFQYRLSVGTVQVDGPME